MAEPEARVEIKPAKPLTHQELMIDFLDCTPDTELTVNVLGPIAQPYWTTLKTDPFGHAQLIWRTQAAGDYTVKAKGEGADAKGKTVKTNLDAEFTVARQEGEPEPDVADADVKTVEEPGDHGDTPSREAKSDEHDPKLKPSQDDPAFKPAVSPAQAAKAADKQPARRKSTERGR